MKTGDIIQRVMSLYYKGSQGDTGRLTPRHVYNKLVSSRANLLIQKAKKRQLVSTWSYQTLPCVEVIDAPISECPALPYTPCNVKRTKYPLPKPISGIQDNNIDWILSLDGVLRFDESNKSEMQHSKGNRYTANTYRFVIDKGYAYLYGRNVPKLVQVRMLCEDPIEGYQFPSGCTDCDTCFDPFDMEFPVEAGYIDYIIESSAKELIEFFNNQKEDIKEEVEK